MHGDGEIHKHLMVGLIDARTVKLIANLRNHIPYGVNGDPQLRPKAGKQHPPGEVAQGYAQLTSIQALQTVHQGVNDLAF